MSCRQRFFPRQPDGSKIEKNKANKDPFRAYNTARLVQDHFHSSKCQRFTYRSWNVMLTRLIICRFSHHHNALVSSLCRRMQCSWATTQRKWHSLDLTCLGRAAAMGESMPWSSSFSTTILGQPILFSGASFFLDFFVIIIPCCWLLAPLVHNMQESCIPTEGKWCC